MDDQRRRQEEKQKASIPKISLAGDGKVLVVQPDGTYKIEQAFTPKGAGEGKPEKFKADFYHPGTGSEASVDMNDPVAVALAEKKGFILGKAPTGFAKIRADMAKAKQSPESEASSLPRTVEDKTPGWMERYWNSATNQTPKQQVMRKKKDVIPRAK